MKLVQGLMAMLVAFGVVACSNSGTSNSVDASAGLNLSSCQQSFSPQQVAADADCTPVAQLYCPAGNRLAILGTSVIDCDGVEVSDIDITAANLTSHYLAIRPSGQSSFNTVYLALHYLNGNVGTFANVARLTELAKARNVLVLVPQAPAVTGSSLGSRWPVSTTVGEPIDQYVSFLSGVVADGRSRFGAGSAKLYVAGLSNGAAMAYLFGCRAADPVLAVEAVAGDMGIDTIQNCVPTHPLGTVIVHGTADAEDPYDGIPNLKPAIPDVHAKFKANNGCTGSDASVDMPLEFDPLLVTLAYTAACNQRRRDYLITIDGGGHVWPGGDADAGSLDLSTLALFGLRTRNFDATLQGFDLLRLAGAG